MEQTENTTTTTTSSTTTSSNQIEFNQAYLKTPGGILKILEAFFGLMVWALVASVPRAVVSPAYKFVLFVSITSWIITLIFSLVFFTGLHQTKLASVPWALVQTLNYALWCVLYFVAFCVSAAFTWNNTSLQAAAAFAFFNTLCYAAHTIVCFRDWKGKYPWDRSGAGGHVSA